MNNAVKFSPSCLSVCAFTLACLGYSTVGNAATTLEQMLAAIEANPMIVYNGIYLNYSEMIQYDAPATTLLVDGSVVVTHSAQATIVEQSATNALEPSEEIEEPLPLFPLQISTNVIGGSNFGSIEIDHDLYVTDVKHEMGVVSTSQGIFALNRTSTQAQVVGSVSVMTNVNSPPVTSIATSVIGSSNVGSIFISLENGATYTDSAPR